MTNNPRGGIFMQVRDIMTKDIVIADTNDTIIDVAKLMAHSKTYEKYLDNSLINCII